MGPDGLIIVDKEVYHSPLGNQAFVDVVNEVIDTGYRRMFYTPEMQRLVVRHQANNIKSQYQLNIEAHSYDHVLEDVAIIAADI
ncbi:hypothetical protein L3X38_037586 [Prunus dulcis]|uniref:Uncharacterized protein n=1 Tax=Prunus dulcis TaxID=3755 RepID=A0AAD4V3N9_PRUDU|nr:hypothetical protein L3X38_037586 [Prunus dulcis]